LPKYVTALYSSVFKTTDMQEYLKSLNPVQYEAVTTTEGPLLVVAGAGSGKTRVLTTRVAYILGQRLAESYNILAVTFTNKAAREMKERIAHLLGADIKSLIVSTFHSFCAMLLRRESQAIGYPSNFTIFDEDDSVSLIKTCVDQLGLSRSQFTPLSLRRKISGLKNRMEDASRYAARASGYFEAKTAEVFNMYEQRLQECAAFDFDDLILRSVQLLSGREDIRSKYQNKFKYILVDEYQDTNHSQYQLLKLLIGPHHNICAVGDEDQSIYRWRGADITNILNFEKDFPGAKVIKMEQNYRSTKTILEAASAVIANNISRKDKVLWTEIDQGEAIRLFLTDTAADEASMVIDTIVGLQKSFPLKEMAVLYRTNAQSRAFEEYLRRMNIPYQIIGGVSFYQRKEIKDLLAYLKLIANPRDDVSFLRIINYPRRGIGETSLIKLRTFAAGLRKPLLEASYEIEKYDDLGARPKGLIKKFIEYIQPFMKEKGEIDIGTLSQEIVDSLRLTEYLIEEDSVLGQNRVENIEEFITGANEFAAIHPEPTLDNFLAEISLYTDIDQYNEIEDKLTLMTLHAAKGLEFGSVFLVGLEEGLFPLMRAIEDPMELEEERRLFYVGATRAKRNLFISLASSRGRFGERGSIPSRFVRELPPGLVETVDNRQIIPGRYNSSASIKIPKHEPEHDESGLHYEFEEDELLRIGRIIMHPTFGRGKVIGVEGSGEAVRLEILFTGIGAKKIMPKYAKLKIIG